MSYNIGKLIYETRKKLHYSRRMVCYGLCSEMTLKKIEDNTIEPNKFLFDMIIERLGKSPDKFEYILSKDEYIFYEKMQEFVDSVINTDIEKAEKSINELEKMSTNTTSKIHILRCKTIFEYDLKHDKQKAFECAKEMLNLTKIDIKNYEELILTRCEYENILMYKKIEYELEMYDIRELIFSLECLVKKIIKSISDEEELTIILPKYLCTLAKLNLIIDNKDEAKKYAEQGLKIVRKSGLIFFSIPLLETALECHYRENYASWLNTLKYVVHTYYENVEKIVDNILLEPIKKEFYLDYEIIKYERKRKEITQEKFIEEIYENTETFSRVENGKESPSKNSYKEIMKRLELPQSRKNGAVISGNFEKLEKAEKIMRELDQNNGKDKVNEIEKLIKEIKNDDNSNNIFYIQNELKVHKGNIQEVIMDDKKWLSIRYPLSIDNIRTPMANEVRIISQLARCKYIINEEDEARTIIKKTLENLTLSRVNKIFRYRSFALISYYNARFNKSNEEATNNIKYEIRCGSISSLYRNLLISSYTDEYNNKKHAENAYYLAVFTEHYEDAKLIKQYLANKFN